VHALAGSAGLNLGRNLFDYGIDGVFWPVVRQGAELVQTGFPVEFQLRSTTNWAHEGVSVVYDLDARTHRILTNRQRSQPLAILILLCLPEDSNAWLTGDEEHLLLKRCCYWCRPDGPPTQNTSSIRIRVPRANVLTPDSLRSIMAMARQEAEK
jgi:hypothetical protein